MLYQVETNDGTFYIETNSEDLQQQCNRYTIAKRKAGMHLCAIRFVYTPCAMIHHNALRHMNFEDDSLRTAIVNDTRSRIK